MGFLRNSLLSRFVLALLLSLRSFSTRLTIRSLSAPLQFEWCWIHPVRINLQFNFLFVPSDASRSLLHRRNLDTFAILPELSSLEDERRLPSRPQPNQLSLHLSSHVTRTPIDPNPRSPSLGRCSPSRLTIDFLFTFDSSRRRR